MLRQSVMSPTAFYRVLINILGHLYVRRCRPYFPRAKIICERCKQINTSPLKSAAARSFLFKHAARFQRDRCTYIYTFCPAGNVFSTVASQILVAIRIYLR